MKTNFLIPLMAVSIACSAYCMDQLQKTAILLLPSEIHAHKVFDASVEFRWDEDQALSLDIWSIRGTSVYGDVRIYDERGNEVPLLYPVSMPLMPDRKMSVVKGQLVRAGLYRLGNLALEKPGLYSAEAEFSSAFMGKTNVRFTTKRRWFKVKP